MYYGLLYRNNIPGMVYSVVSTLWGDSSLKYQGAAYNLIRGTISAETQDATAKDNSWLAGMGLTQFDKMPFYDVRDRALKYLKKDILKIEKEFHININEVEWEHLRYAPGLAIIFTALFYRLVPKKFPIELEEQATYWKKYYNTVHGAGTIDHYLKSYNKFVDPKEFQVLREYIW